MNTNKHPDQRTLRPLLEIGSLAERQRLAALILEGVPVMYRVGVYSGQIYVPHGVSLHPGQASMTFCGIHQMDERGAVREYRLED